MSVKKHNIIPFPGHLQGGGEPPHNGGMEARVTVLEEAVKNLPTKTDLDGLRQATKADLAELRADMAEGREAVHKLLVENSRWTHTALVGMLSICVIGILGLLFTIWNASKSTAHQASAAAVQQPYQQPPIIINIPATSPSTPFTEKGTSP